MYDLVCKVSQRLEDGELVVVTGKSKNEADNASVLETLKKDCANKFKEADTCLYYTIRLTLNGVKDNWKCDTYTRK